MQADDVALPSSVAALSQENLQNLIATSTGFIDVYDIAVYGDAHILLPQNMVLSAMKVSAQLEFVEWHDKQLPTHNLASPHSSETTALVIEGDVEQTRFVILSDRMPEALRLRISQMRDIDKATLDLVFQYVQVDDKIYQIPNLSQIQAQLFTAEVIANAQNLSQ
jgi:hypothetical protein